MITIMSRIFMRKILMLLICFNIAIYADEYSHNNNMTLSDMQIINNQEKIKNPTPSLAQQTINKAQSQYELGLMYYNGTGGVQKDLNQALTWIKKAAIGGSSEAQSWLTRLEDPVLKDIARTKMLKNGQIIEAYQAGLIDKDTADLYLQKQSMDNATRAAQQQTAASQQQADAARRVANAAEDANTPNLLNQQLQNITNHNQMNQMINQQNINNNMRKYY
jgi:hypothetical protein